MSEDLNGNNVATESEVTGQDEVAAPQSIADLRRKMQVSGTVSRIGMYGAFIDLGLDADAILHVSQLAQGKRIKEALKVGQLVDAWVSKVDHESKQVMLTMHPPLAVEWQDLSEGKTYKGKVIRLEAFGAFVDIGAEKEGLVHVSELSHDYIKHPSQAINVGDEVDVQVLSFNRKKRRINLSVKALLEAPEGSKAALKQEAANYDYEEEQEDFEEMPTAMEVAWQRASGTSGDNFGKGKKKKGRKGEKKRRRSRQDQLDIYEQTLSMSRDDY